jgi:transcriptional regulator with XRE-family HTH domain
VVVKSETSKATIDRILSVYDIGKKLQQLRLKKKLGLVELGKHTGLSPSLLSQLENGKLVPTLPTLARIAMVFDVGLDYFFASRPRKSLFSIVRAAERIVFPESPAEPKPSYEFECLAFSVQDKSLQAYLAVFPWREPGETRPHFHPGAEFILVLEGTLVVHCQGEDYELRAGDSAYFDASEPHSYRGASRKSARAVVITTPPRT